ncbi:hypothetical protein J4218_05495 [Candidatus Pacearchaeota archaeon]|nr:hypothetical protein [uncultured archaeon]MBS3079549.1 hypothetical protein [Candidatus Pacearchaeota archaeon]
MAQLKVTSEDLQLLRLKSDFAYETFRRAIETPEPGLVQTAEYLYRYDLGGLLAKVTVLATNDFMLLNKSGKRAKLIEEFLLQYALMYEGPSIGGDYEIQIARDLNDNMGGLKAFLDAEDDVRNEEGKLFRLIQKSSGELRIKGRYDLLLNSLDYVRAKYKMPASK